MTIFRMLILSVCLGLLGCNSLIHNKSHHELALCKQQCEVRAQSCASTCSNNDINCKTHAKQSARRDYCAYKNEQIVEGGYVARDLQSFQDQLKCRKTTCNCYADFNVCMQSCKGTICKELSAPICL